MTHAWKKVGQVRDGEEKQVRDGEEGQREILSGEEYQGVSYRYKSVCVRDESARENKGGERKEKRREIKGPIVLATSLYLCRGGK